MNNLFQVGILEQGFNNFWPWIDASGGIISYDGDFKIHTFNSSSNFIVYRSGYDASVLIVGGGGNGASYINTGSGGGGGGEIKQINMSFNVQTYPVTAGSASHSSYFNTVNASFGIDGSSWESGASGSGNAGGLNDFDAAAGGGGGDSSVGQNFPAQFVGGQGGSGKLINISGTYKGYGGGGGGGALVTRGIGYDGGGTGSSVSGVPINATDASANSGGGGGGGTSQFPLTGGGKGGSGVVIIRYKYK